MTIHRGLSELKLIDAKIQKQIDEILPTGLYQKDKLVNGVHKKEDFQANAQSKFDSVKDLIERKAKIKNAIVESNSRTMVEVAGKHMSVADAISHKALIKFKKSLIDSLEKKHKYAIGELNKYNEGVNANVQKILEATFGKENVKAGKDDVDAVRKPYMDANEAHLFDPLSVDKTVEALEKEVTEFEAEVDAVLSESNAITIIEV